MKINFTKMMASGNDFIVIDNCANIIPDPKQLTKVLCERRISVGADGILLLEKGQEHKVTMRIMNADGSEAEMCGNGARCAALFCHKVLKFGKEFTMDTIAGPVHSCIGDDTIKVRLPEPKDYRDLSPIEVADGIFYFYFINTSVPHVVIFEESIDDLDVVTLGREIRHHSHFEPQGANVNFVKILDRGHIAIRTYERGVEDETLACGTGSTAAAITSSLIGKCESPVSVLTRGGEQLTISFEKHMYDISDVYLEGQAHIVFNGTVEYT